MGRVAITGSVAFDTIMVFDGRFGDHILADQTHVINVSFLVDRVERRRGGTAANIAYTLALLGERPLLCAAVGNDFEAYDAALTAAGVDTTTALRCSDVSTANAFITTDLDDNQITAFHPGAMSRAAGVDLEGLVDVEHVVVAPDAPDAMRHHVAQSVSLGARLVFAPAQQLSSMDDATLAAGLDAAWLVIGNDYELEVVSRRSGRDIESLAAAGALVVRTRGAEGSEIRAAGRIHQVPAAAVAGVVDPTGAGDAYLAGLLFGLRSGWSADTAGRVGALAAAYVVEQAGPQTHRFSPSDFAHRYQAEFGSPPG